MEVNTDKTNNSPSHTYIHIGELSIDRRIFCIICIMEKDNGF
jgi:hypothetical protein